MTLNPVLNKFEIEVLLLHLTKICRKIIIFCMCFPLNRSKHLEQRGRKGTLTQQQSSHFCLPSRGLEPNRMPDNDSIAPHRLLTPHDLSSVLKNEIEFKFDFSKFSLNFEELGTLGLGI